jgi:hypothetical protein
LSRRGAEPVSVDHNGGGDGKSEGASRTWSFRARCDPKTSVVFRHAGTSGWAEIMKRANGPESENRVGRSNCFENDATISRSSRRQAVPRRCRPDQESPVVRTEPPRKIAVRTKLISPRRDNPRNFDRVFDGGYIAPPGYLSPSIEVVYIPGTGTMVAVSVAFSESVSAFVGYAATDAASIDRVQRMLRPGNVDVRLEELWNTQRREEEEPARFDLDVK